MSGKVILDLHSHLATRADAMAILSGQTYPLERVALRAVSTIVDIGAHCGVFASLCAATYPGARIRAFEPLRANYAVANLNFAQYPNIEMNYVGLSDFNGVRALAYAADTGYTETPERPHEQQAVNFQRASEALGDLGEISILKIATEGYEYPIVSDLGDLIERVSVLFMDVRSDEDRREIEAMLGMRFVLFHARCDAANRYRLAYASRRAINDGAVAVPIEEERQG